MKQLQEFSPEAQAIIKEIQQNRKHLFITGKAGTGKSTLLNYIRSLPTSDMIVLAPTGIAALNVQGETIHSFFRLKPGYELDEAKNMKITGYMRHRYKQLDTVIIDEISMLRADILDAIDVFLRRVKNNIEAFGGVRMIFFGDLFQLPPVLTEEEEENFLKKYPSPYFFAARAFQPVDLFSPPFSLHKMELSQVYRQKDPSFVQLLNHLRENKMTAEDFAHINQRLDKEVPPNEACMYLMATNAQAHEKNMEELRKIPEPMLSFEAIKSGNIGHIQPNDPLIHVKVGAQVMFVNNDQKKRWVNGSIGTITGYKEKKGKETDVKERILEVTLENGRPVEVVPFTWEISKYRFEKGRFIRENLGFFRQMPLKSAWAITIHKSQGKTFHHIAVDLGAGSFAHGQCYVALSRCTSIEGIYLKQAIRPEDVFIDPAIQQYHKEGKI